MYSMIVLFFVALAAGIIIFLIDLKEKREEKEAIKPVKKTSYSVDEEEISWEFNLAGTNFLTEDETKHLKEVLYEYVYFQREPDNQYDSNAIKVVSGAGGKLGYVPRDMTHFFIDNNGDLKKCKCYLANVSRHKKPFAAVSVYLI